MIDSFVSAALLNPGATVPEWKTAVSKLSDQMGWSAGGKPFAAVVSPASRVLLKPNWVMDKNKGPWGLDPLVTSPSLVIAVAELVLECDPLDLALGDAPLQGCDIVALWRDCGISEWADDARARGFPVRGPLDFRRTIAIRRGTVLEQSTEQRDIGEYRLVNLESESLLEPITGDDPSFRVTQYPPQLMRARHHRGHHEYLIASEVLARDVIINLPKLKTHKKAGVTAALKNLVGINGNKEFLPHHRIGSPAEGGDCYPRSNPLKRAQEWMYDRQNQLRSVGLKKLLRWPIGALSLLSRYHRERFGLEGAWSGNDTVWRMSLDLNRALLYADANGKMSDTAQRRELHIVDAVVAGQGDGPLASEPFNLGVVLAANSAAAADWIGARLLGYDPKLIPIVRGAFEAFRYPISDCDARKVRCQWTTGEALEFTRLPLPTRYPEGWLDCIDDGLARGSVVGTTFNHRDHPGLSIR